MVPAAVVQWITVCVREGGAGEASIQNKGENCFHNRRMLMILPPWSVPYKSLSHAMSDEMIDYRSYTHSHHRRHCIIFGFNFLVQNLTKYFMFTCNVQGNFFQTSFRFSIGVRWGGEIFFQSYGLMHILETGGSERGTKFSNKGVTFLGASSPLRSDLLVSEWVSQSVCVLPLFHPFPICGF